MTEPGTLRADDLGKDDRSELSNGQPLFCAPTGHRGSRAQIAGAVALATDPAAESAGIDAGFSPDPGTLRAPDIAIGNVTDEPGWGSGAPKLAVEYADTGQDEDGLGEKIRDLLCAGTRWIWVVRLVGPRRVEVHEAGAPVRTVGADGVLEAPGVLENPVPVAALYDREMAEQVALRNLLQRRLWRLLEQRFGKLTDETRSRVSGATESDLVLWTDRAPTAPGLPAGFAYSIGALRSWTVTEG